MWWMFLVGVGVGFAGGYCVCALLGVGREDDLRGELAECRLEMEAARIRCRTYAARLKVWDAV